MSRLDDLERAGVVAAAMAAGASGKRVTYDRQSGWTTRHGGTNDTTTSSSRDGGK